MDEFIHLGPPDVPSTQRDRTSDMLRALNAIEDGGERRDAFTSLILSVVMNHDDPVELLIEITETVFQAIPRATEERRAFMARKN